MSKRYVPVVDSKKCINCKACVVACRAENQVPLGHSRDWITEEHRGTWPKLLAAFEPEQCHHCLHPSCVRVCPTGASYQRDDGIVVVNESDCIGCSARPDAPPRLHRHSARGCGQPAPYPKGIWRLGQRYS